MSWARSSRRTVSVGLGVPVATRSPISYSRRSPMRQGMVLPHASSAENFVSRRARSTTHARSSATTIEPEPTWAPAVAQGVVLVGRVEQVGGQQPAGRAADEERLEAALADAAGEPDELAAAACPAGPRRSPPPSGPRSWTSDRAGAGLAADRGERRRALADDERHGRERLDVVDDGRLVEQAALGRVGRALLGLAAACPRAP